jgi:DNA replication and repair protein RecF
VTAAGVTPRASPCVATLELVDFRCFRALTTRFTPGLTVLSGANGEGKTSMLEAVCWAARGRSFRRVPDAALVRSGTDGAVLRTELVDTDRRVTLAAELHAHGRSRVLLNGQPVARRRDLVDHLRVTVFTPDDLQLVKGGPSERRWFLDEILGSIAPRYDRARSDYERVLRQRNALLKGGVRDADAKATLAVFDEQLVASGSELVRGRLGLADRLTGPTAQAYARLAGTSTVEARYLADWHNAPLEPADRERVAHLLATAVERERPREIERRVTLVGPHRDEWLLGIDGRDARTHASQGEQRSLALALRLAGHTAVQEATGRTPVLLLDDVFSELDDRRAEALVELLPHGQTLLTTAGHVPRVVSPDRVLRLSHHELEEVA